jgi:hypothetical protein
MEKRFIGQTNQRAIEGASVNEFLVRYVGVNTNRKRRMVDVNGNVTTTPTDSDE